MLFVTSRDRNEGRHSFIYLEYSTSETQKAQTGNKLSGIVEQQERSLLTIEIQHEDKEYDQRPTLILCGHRLDRLRRNPTLLPMNAYAIQTQNLIGGSDHHG